MQELTRSIPAWLIAAISPNSSPKKYGTRTARWEQAFSTDGGATWETNWTMDMTRIED